MDKHMYTVRVCPMSSRMGKRGREKIERDLNGMKKREDDGIFL